MTEPADAIPYVPDLTGVSLALAVPCGGGLYTSSFMKGTYGTIEEVRKLGGDIDLMEVMYCADIALARNRLLGLFYRSKHTHLMWIDSDMGFSRDAVVRLVDQKKDFICAVGPKKMYPIQFAANKTNDLGQPMPVTLDPSTGVAELGEVGMAFVLLSRSCVERMIEAYQNLAFFSDEEGTTLDYALFDPIITGDTPARRLSEDYAFCKRWRDIGGKVEVLADIVLTHTGMHTFTGAFAQLFGYPLGTRVPPLPPTAV